MRITELEYAQHLERKGKKPKAPAGPPEPTHGDIMRSVKALLKACGIEHYQNIPGPISERGLPDLTAILEGRYVGIEIKKGKDELRSDQIKWRRRIEEADGLYIVVRSVDDVIDGLGIRDRFLNMK